MIGATTSQTLDLTLINNGDMVYGTSTIKVEIGLKTGSTIEYIPIGIYNIDDIEKNDYTIKITAFDNMIKFEKNFTTTLGDNLTLQQIVSELTRITGVQFTGSLPSYTVKKLEGFTCREVLGYVASICGGNAVITRDGKFNIITPKDISYTIGTNNYFDYKREETKYKIGKISCQVGEDVLSKGSLGTDSMELEFENPWVNATILTDIYNKLNGFEYLGYSMKWQGDLSLDVGDIITVTDKKGVVRKHPILSQKFTYTGGLTSELEAKGENKNKNSYSSSGPSTNKVDRIVTELAIVNKALIDVAYIGDLTAGNIKFDTASGGTLDLQTLLAKHITGENGQFLNITSSNTVIANAVIKDAMIENISVSKLLAGTISTNKFTVASDDGGITIVGPTMQFKDKNNKVRIQMGQDTQGSFNFILRGEDGTTTLIDHTGIKEKAIADDLIKSNMVAADAIGEKQINYSSLITGLNKDTNTSLIKASKVAIDFTGQSLEVSFNSLKSNVDNIQVGGRNYIRESNFSFEKSNYWLYLDGVKEYQKKKCAYQTYNGTGEQYISTTRYYLSNLKGKQITLSFLAACTPNMKSFEVYILSRKEGSSKDWDYAPNKYFTLTEDLTRYTWTYTIPNDIDSFYIRFDNNGSTDGQDATLYVTEVKLEEGNKVTDWSPSPEEIEEKIQVNTTSISTMQGSIETLIKNTTIEQDGSKITLKDSYTNFVQQYDNFKLSVSNTYTTKTENNILKNQLEQSKQNIRCNGVGAKVNFSTFTTPNPGEIYLHGYDSNNNPIDTNGLLYWNGTTISVSKGMINPGNSCGIGNDVIIFISQASGDILGAWYNKSLKKWYYTRFIGSGGPDTSEFTPSQTHIAIGVLNMSGDESFNYAYLFETPQSLVNLTIGSMDLLTRMNNAELKIQDDSIIATVSEVYSTKTELVNAISDIQVGGRNLLSGTKDWTLGKGSGEIQESKYNGFSILYKNNSSGSGNSDVTAWYDKINVKPNTEYTLSFYAKGSGNFVSYFYPSNVASGYSSEGVKTVASDGSIHHSLTSEWKRYWITWKTLSTSSGLKSVLPMRLLVGSIGYICGVKFEEGNKVTDWSPSPEEVESSIISLETWRKEASVKIQDDSIIATVSQTITKAKNEAIDSANGTTDTKLQNYSTTSQMKTYIGQELDKITLSVSDTYSTKKELTDTIGAIKVGGRNLILNSNFKTMPSLSEKSSAIANATIKDVWENNTSNYFGKLLLIDSNNGDAYITLSEFINVSPSTQYTFSCDYWSAGSIKSHSSYFYFYKSDKTLSSNPFLGMQISIRNDKVRRRHIITFTTPSDCYYLRTRYGINNSAYGWFIVDGAKLEIGNKATDWSPSPEDVDNSINSLETWKKEASIKIQDDSIISTVSQTITKAKNEAIDSANNSTDTKLLNYSTTSQMQTYIGQELDKITLSVSNNYLSKSDAALNYVTNSSLELSEKNLKASFKSTGGYNLIRNSTGYNGISLWTTNAIMGTAVNNNIGGASSTYMYLDNGTTTSERFAFSKRFKLKANTKYTLSGWFHNYTKCPNFDVFLLSSTTLEEDSSSTGYSNAQTLIAGQNTNGAWKYLSITFTTPVNIISGYIRIDNNGYNSAGSGDNRVHWSSLILNEGEEQPWSPHPSEIYDGSTTIDANGVTIKNGALTVQNNAGATVLQGDVNGNLTITGIFINKNSNGVDAIKIDNTNIYFYDWERNARELGVIYSSYITDYPSVRGFSLAHNQEGYLTLGYRTGTNTFGHYITFDKYAKNPAYTSPIRVHESTLFHGAVNLQDRVYIPNKICFESGYNATTPQIFKNTGDSRNILCTQVSVNAANDGYMIQTNTGGVLFSILAGRSYPILCNNHTQVSGNFTVTGSKNSLQETENYGQRLINAYETAEYYFGDIGSGTIRNGECLIWIDDIFKECINTDIEYHVFTQAYKGDIRKIERHKNYFVVYGEENTEFSWEVKAKRKGYENIRLDSPDIGTVEEYAVFDDEDLKAKTTEDTLLDILTFDLENLLMEG